MADLSGAVHKFFGPFAYTYFVAAAKSARPNGT